MSKKKKRPAMKRAVLAGVAVSSVLALAACGESKSSDDSGLNKAGTLTVGMNLQFKPEMYLDANGNPAGYDVDLLNALAADMGVKLDIKNLDFNGLIPGLQSKKFDLVSVGLTATDERKKVIDFTRAYVPYTSVLAVKKDDTTPATVDAFNASDKIISALQGSTGEQLAKKAFPKAKVQTYGDQNSSLLQVATGRANGVVVEDYILAQYQQSNPDQVRKAELPEPLDLAYGSWAVQKGNEKLTAKLNAFLCKAQNDGSLAEMYKKNFGVSEFPAMPEGC